MSDFEDYRGEDLDNPELNDFLEKAEQAATDENYEEAVEILENAAEKFPESVLAHYNLGVVYYMRLKEDLDHVEVWEDYSDEEGYYEEAVSEFQQTIDLDPDFVPALNNLGRLYALREMWEEAIEQWEHSLEVQPNQPEIEDSIKTAQENLEEEEEDDEDYEDEEDEEEDEK